MKIIQNICRRYTWKVPLQKVVEFPHPEADDPTGAFPFTRPLIADLASQTEGTF